MKSSRMPFNTVKSKRIASVVDQTENIPDSSTTRSIYQSTDGQFYELNYVFKGILLKDSTVKKITETEFEDWKARYLPEYLNFLPIFEGKPNGENISYSLYKCIDGRYFEVTRKIGLGENQSKDTVVWLSPQKIDVWKAKHTDLPHRDPFNE
jgi:hypothetical protein